MPSRLSQERKEAALEEERQAALKAHPKGKQNSGGEASKRAKAMSELELQQHEIDMAEGHDNRKGNIGPSGQGGHRGRERSNMQSSASGRPDHSAQSVKSH